MRLFRIIGESDNYIYSHIYRNRPPVPQRGHVKGNLSWYINQSIKTPVYVVELAKELIKNIPRSEKNCKGIQTLRIKSKDVLKIRKVIETKRIKL